MKTFTKYKTVIINGKNRILYRMSGRSALYIRHKGAMIRYSEYKKMIGGNKNVLSAFDYYYTDDINTKVGDDFNAKFDELFDILNHKRAIQQFLNQYKNC